jgi:hypothetical protein
MLCMCTGSAGAPSGGGRLPTSIVHLSDTVVALSPSFQLDFGHAPICLPVTASVEVTNLAQDESLVIRDVRTTSLDFHAAFQEVWLKFAIYLWGLFNLIVNCFLEDCFGQIYFKILFMFCLM